MVERKYAAMSSECELLHELIASRHRLGASFDPAAIPSSGIYVMFQKSEQGHGGDRIVRVGTHRRDGELPSRLIQHFIRENKDRSIFRKHVGRTLLTRINDPFIVEWDLDLTTKASRDVHGGAIDAVRKAEVEREVSTFLADEVTFVTFPVPIRAMRLDIEKSLLATIAACQECGPSPEWLGNDHPNAKIRKSGLWNIQGLNGTPFDNDEIARRLIPLLSDH